jgi:hypothetical protein
LKAGPSPQHNSSYGAIDPVGVLFCFFFRYIVSFSSAVPQPVEKRQDRRLKKAKKEVL